jgi:hypothetical protein
VVNSLKRVASLLRDDSHQVDYRVATQHGLIQSRAGDHIARNILKISFVTEALQKSGALDGTAANERTNRAPFSEQPRDHIAADEAGGAG